ncbi:MAG: SBBP repeat-containing protein [Candidatus Zixiibacteriota bacterium]
MILLLFLGAALLVGADVALAQPQGGPDNLHESAVSALASMPLAFTENAGQWDSQVLYRANAGDMAIWITSDGVTYQLARRSEELASGYDPGAPGTPPASVETRLLRSVLVGANPRPGVSRERRMAYTCNYFLGNDPGLWRTDVPNYESVVVTDVYPGIDLAFYGNGRRMEYDFRVSARADHARIRIEYQGADSLAITSDGALEITSGWGKLRELAPVVYQEVGGKRKAISGRYQFHDKHSFGFLLGPEYNPALPVVIDPVLVYSTYLGGTSNDAGRGIAVDSAGAVYIAGETFSSNFPTMNPLQPTRLGYLSAFVTKLSSSGNSLVYSTYLGGSVTDAASAIAVAADGSAIVAGFASSSDFPTHNPLQGQYGGGVADAFIAKLSSQGNSLLYSTYLGGSDWDQATAIAVGSTGAAYVTGYTLSDDFPTLDPFQESNQGDYDAFVAKLTVGGARLHFSTYLGGISTDAGNAIAVDLAGSAYVTGRTLSPWFPISNEFQGSLQGYYQDAFVSKFAPLGDSLIFSTYLGGENDDYGSAIAIDKLGATYVVGRTRSTAFPTRDALQDNNAGGYDAFVTRLAYGGDSLIFSTYLGGSGDDYGLAVCVDALGAVFAAGRTASSDFTTLDAYQNNFRGGASDAFVARLSGLNGSSIYSSYLGGSGVDVCYSAATNRAGTVFLSGFTESNDFPTLTPYQGVLNSLGADVFAVKFYDSLSEDQDDDGIPDVLDNCPAHSNPGQEDVNLNGVGDACEDCCTGRVGDANGSGEDEPTIGDVSVMIDAKFIAGSCAGILACLSEADINQSGGVSPSCEDVTIGDISVLIDYLFISGPNSAILPDCF